MFPESRPNSAAERRLADLFAGGRANEAELVTRLREVERLRGDVRLVHLRHHLMTRDALTEPQRLVHQERRWGSRAASR